MGGWKDCLKYTKTTKRQNYQHENKLLLSTLKFIWLKYIKMHSIPQDTYVKLKNTATKVFSNTKLFGRQLFGVSKMGRRQIKCMINAFQVYTRFNRCQLITFNYFLLLLLYKYFISSHFFKAYKIRSVSKVISRLKAKSHNLIT